MPHAINRCLLCRHSPIEAEIDGRVVTTSCPACNAILRIEFDPPDQPELRARIERLDDAAGASTTPAHADVRSLRVRSR
jgi:hypothetical protein